MAFTEDFTAFFSTAEFATDATLDGAAVRGIFDADYELGSGGVAGFASTQPVFTLPSASLMGDPVGLSLQYLAVTYTVSSHEPDGTGISLLMLEKV
ncbi:hypothetical protein HC248_01416 [Polaromonas vacuolata]|uniref:Uncharacterized protein n=1 Tax=Polaromonas vacuolata TaxID=37448 RepID=A0A6H2H8H8_9BURK|nr:hypothetical protein [Polaromonas vacuolata]QJC56130.1 hypothetical protein HC248_01416 [Polaromonas vacuolata]